MPCTAMNAAVLTGKSVSTPLIRTRDNLISRAHGLRELDACRTEIGGRGLLAAPGARRRQCWVTVAVSLGGRNAQSKGPAPGKRARHEFGVVAGGVAAFGACRGGRGCDGRPGTVRALRTCG